MNASIVPALRLTINLCIQGAVFSLGVVGFLATRGRKEKLQAADFSSAQQKFAELERRQSEERSELERSRQQREELLDFDRRLQNRRDNER